MQHDRPVLIAVLANISRVQSLGQNKVELQRAALPSPANRIAQMIFNLRPVKSPLARQFFPFKANFAQRIAKPLLGAVPNIVFTGAHIRTQRQFDRDIFKTQIRIDLRHQSAKIDRLGNNLIFAAENMRVILRHLPHPHQPVQRAMRLIAVTAAKLGHAYRQVAIRLNALFENLHMGRAVHRLDGHQIGIGGNHRIAVFGGRHFIGHDKHVFAKLIPVAGLLPKALIQKLRRLHFFIIMLAQAAADILLKLLPDNIALGVPEHAALRLFLQME